MSDRIVVGLHKGADLERTKQALERAGAKTVREPSPTEPDVLVLTLSPDRDREEFLRTARALDGVRYAEPDVWQSTY